MAKRAAVKPWASKKPAAKSTSRKPAASRKVTKAPPPPDTEADLWAQIGTVLTTVDAYMPERKYNTALFNRYDQEFGGEKKRLDDLVQRLDVILEPTGTTTLDLIRDKLGATPGNVPSWAQHGTFLLWIAYIPCCCIWSGFAESGTAVIVAADPNKEWFAPSGAVSLSRVSIYQSHKSPADLFRAHLTNLTTMRQTKPARTYNTEPKDLGPAFNLHALTDDAKAACIATLAEPGNEWLTAALKRGPVNPIPMPDHLRAVQVSLF